jgi:hypothetical protein
MHGDSPEIFAHEFSKIENLSLCYPVLGSDELHPSNTSVDPLLPQRRAQITQERVTFWSMRARLAIMASTREPFMWARICRIWFCTIFSSPTAHERTISICLRAPERSAAQCSLRQGQSPLPYRQLKSNTMRWWCLSEGPVSSCVTIGMAARWQLMVPRMMPMKACA